MENWFIYRKINYLKMDKYFNNDYYKLFTKTLHEIIRWIWWKKNIVFYNYIPNKNNEVTNWVVKKFDLFLINICQN